MRLAAIIPLTAVLSCAAWPRTTTGRLYVDGHGTPLLILPEPVYVDVLQLSERVERPECAEAGAWIVHRGPRPRLTPDPHSAFFPFNEPFLYTLAAGVIRCDPKHADVVDLVARRRPDGAVEATVRHRDGQAFVVGVLDGEGSLGKVASYPFEWLSAPPAHDVPMRWPRFVRRHGLRSAAAGFGIGLCDQYVNGEDGWSTCTVDPVSTRGWVSAYRGASGPPGRLLVPDGGTLEVVIRNLPLDLEHALLASFGGDVGVVRIE